MSSNKNIAFIISGAAAYIPQEIACIKALMQGLYPGAKGDITPTLLTGTSSGSLSTTLVNAILADKLDWGTLEDSLLPSITNDKVYTLDLEITPKMTQDMKALVSALTQALKNPLAIYHFVQALGDLKNLNPKTPLKDIELIIKALVNGIKSAEEVKFSITAIEDIAKLIKDTPDLPKQIDALTNMFEDGYIFDTSPLRQTLTQYVNDQFGFKTLGDLPCHSYISAVNATSGDERRFDSQNHNDGQISLVDILMASTAIPVAFPQQDVAGQAYVDGGTGTDNIPVLDAIQSGEKFDEVYVITYKHNFILGQPIKHYTNLPKLLSNLIFSREVAARNIVPFQLGMSLSLVRDPNDAYFYMPAFKEDFNPLDFNSMPAQLKLSTEYVHQNGPQKTVDVLKKLDFPTS